MLIAPDKLNWFSGQTVTHVEGWKTEVLLLFQGEFVLVGSSEFVERIKNEKM